MTEAVSPGMSVWSYGSEVNALGRRPDLMEAEASALAVTQLPPRLLRSIAPKAFVLVAAGGAHALAVGSDGAVYAWGWNQYGQCGLGAESVSATVPLPRAVPFLQMRRAVQIACGAAHSAVLVRGEASGDGGGRTDGRASAGRRRAPGGGGGGGGGEPEGIQCYTFGAHAAGQLGRVVTSKSTHASPRPAELSISLMAPPVEIPVEIVVPSAPPAPTGDDGGGCTCGARALHMRCTCNDVVEEEEEEPPIVPHYQPLACGAGHCAVLAADGALWT